MNVDTFYSTIASVSFTFAGFVLLVVASDKESRNFWYQDQPHRAVANLHLLYLCLPGFSALAALIRPMLDETITPFSPAIPFIGMFYLLVTVIYRNINFQLDNTPSIVELNEMLHRIKADIAWGGLMLLMFFLGGLIFVKISTHEPIPLLYGVFMFFLVLVLLVGLFLVSRLLRVGQGFAQESHIPKSSKSTTSPLESQEQAPTAVQGRGMPTWVGGVLAAGVIFLGALLANKKRK